MALVELCAVGHVIKSLGRQDLRLVTGPLGFESLSEVAFIAVATIVWCLTTLL